MSLDPFSSPALENEFDALMRDLHAGAPDLWWTHDDDPGTAAFEESDTFLEFPRFRMLEEKPRSGSPGRLYPLPPDLTDPFGGDAA